MRGRVILRIPTQSRDDCEALVNSLRVDEAGLPRGLASSIWCDGDVMVYELNFDVNGNKLLSVYNTLDDLIRNVKAVLNSLSRIK
ncbi:KEOPS complex subunit Pcc1 [Vulcanisaeta thermophila]|uniref:KEOPS complex subunit Pcc1 n=1 Tax=Vulcanisaeta thermophila TaxID=867917 RepID=UPI0009FDA2EC|nr:KEOPS complex subunit Pcc1 [Vulcanisaeta thermophila]